MLAEYLGYHGLGLCASTIGTAANERELHLCLDLLPDACTNALEVI